MDPILAEEKKDATEERGTREKGGGGDIVTEGECAEDEELEELPKEVAKLIGVNRRFESDEELEAALVEAGVGDLHVALVDGRPLLVMPSDQHNDFTSEYVADFFGWSKLKWGACSGTHKIHLSNGKSRDPDLSYWGYPRCQKNCKRPNPRGSIPDVVIQFSWKNKKAYEEDAMDDMMNRGLEKQKGLPSTTCPALGYLIKVKFSKKRPLAGSINGSKTQDMEGLDIYRLPHGTTIADACNSANPNAKHWQYFPGGPEVWITISPQDLGITGFWAVVCGKYKIRASTIFQGMQEYHQQRQLEGLAT